MKRPSPLLARLLWLFLLVQFAYFLAGLHLRTNMEYFRATLELLKDFKAIAPFQLRVLLPAVAAFLEEYCAVHYAEAFYQLEALGWFLILVVARPSLAILELDLPERAKTLLSLTVTIPLVLVTMLPFREYRFGPYDKKYMPLFFYPYDVYSALFALVQFLLVFRLFKEWRWKDFTAYLALFSLASVNRETQFFFIPYFVAVLYRRLPRQRLALATLLQVAIFLTIRGLILVLFKNNANPDAFDAATPYEIHLKFNIVFLVTHYFGSVAYTVTCGGVALAVFFAFKQLSWFLRRSLVAYALPLLLLILVIGYLHETRVFLEIMPLLWLATIQAMHWLCTAREKENG